MQQTRIQMVDIRNQYAAIKDEVDAALQGVVDSTAFINGPEVKEFARELADYLGAPHVIPCGNGTDALQIALMALDLEQGDEVITTPFTFVATAEVIALLKLKPVFVDVEPGTFNMNVEATAAAIGDRTRCLLPVHLFGQAADMDAIVKLSCDNNLRIVEDNAQSIGAKYTFADGRVCRTGTIGDIGCTSFYPTKNLGGYGDGGAISTNDDKIAQRIRMVANHGSERKYYYDSIGVNSRLDSFQAAILRVKLKRLDAYNDARRRAADMYDERLRDLDAVTIPVRSASSTHVFHQYTIRVSEKRDELKQHLADHGIPSMIYYPVPLHQCSVYQAFGYKDGDFPVSEQLAAEVLSLPMHSELDEEQVDTICNGIRGFFG